MPLSSTACYCQPCLLLPPSTQISFHICHCPLLPATACYCQPCLLLPPFHSINICHCPLVPATALTLTCARVSTPNLSPRFLSSLDTWSSSSSSSSGSKQGSGSKGSGFKGSRAQGSGFKSSGFKVQVMVLALQSGYWGIYVGGGGAKSRPGELAFQVRSGTSSQESQVPTQ